VKERVIDSEPKNRLKKAGSEKTLLLCFNRKRRIAAEPAEEVQMANSGIFDLDKNQLLIGLKIRPKGQILGFSTSSLFSLKIHHLKSFDIRIIH